jgi:hypothetical protein
MLSISIIAFCRLILLTVMLAVGVCPCRAADNAAENLPRDFDHGRALSLGLKNFIFRSCMGGDNLEFYCYNQDDLRTLGLGMPYISKPIIRDKEQRLADSLVPLLAYRGGFTIRETIMAGMKFYSLSQSISILGNPYIHTGLRFKGRRGTTPVKTGFFLDF